MSSIEEILNEYKKSPKILYLRASTVNAFLSNEYNSKTIEVFEDFIKSNWDDYKFVPNDVELINIINESNVDNKETLLNIVKNFNINNNIDLHEFLKKIPSFCKNRKLQNAFSKFTHCQYGINMEDIVLGEFCKTKNKKLLYSNESLNNEDKNNILFDENKKKYKTIFSTDYYKLNLVGIPDGITTNGEIVEIKTRTRVIGNLKPENIDQIKSYLGIYNLKKAYLVEALIKDDYNIHLSEYIPKNIEMRITEMNYDDNFFNNKNFIINIMLVFNMKLYEKYYNKLNIKQKIKAIKDNYSLILEHNLLNDFI